MLSYDIFHVHVQVSKPDLKEAVFVQVKEDISVNLEVGELVDWLVGWWLVGWFCLLSWLVGWWRRLFDIFYWQFVKRVNGLFSQVTDEARQGEARAMLRDETVPLSQGSKLLVMYSNVQNLVHSGSLGLM